VWRWSGFAVGIRFHSEGLAAMDFNNQTLSGEVRLDGHSYFNCLFKNCVLIFSATDVVNLNSCRFESCEFRLAGPAAWTVAFLQGLHQNGTRPLREFVNKVVSAIQKPLS
jgi:hypothetical protein